MDFRFSLEEYSNKKSKHLCPACKDRRHTFVKYIDNKTKSYLGEKVGRCDRESKCEYHYTPKQFFMNNDQESDYERKMLDWTPPPPKPTSYIDNKFVNEFMESYKGNGFIIFLYKNFPKDKVNNAIRKYRIGTSIKFKGSVVFWQIDSQNIVHNGKVMVYSPNTGKRSKRQFTSIPKLLGLKDYNSDPCFFGEHLLNDNNKPIAIVESEKTAIIASLLFDNFIWLASGGKSNLTTKRCEVLQSREVTLFPDSDAHELWSKKANEYGFDISEILKDREGGYDLADHILEKIKEKKGYQLINKII